MAAVNITMGKLVAPETSSSKKVPWPPSATPWSASDHHLYWGSPILATPKAWSPNCDTFSYSVIWSTKFLALTWYGNDELQYGNSFIFNPNLANRAGSHTRLNLPLSVTFASSVLAVSATNMHATKIWSNMCKNYLLFFYYLIIFTYFTFMLDM